MAHATSFCHRPARRAAQAGASLMFALVTLVALGLAAAALVRSVDTGAAVLGNLGAKKATAIAADRVTQRAINFLVNNMTESQRQSDLPNEGYYANSKEDYDITGFDRTDANRRLINWTLDGSCSYATSGQCDPQTRPSASFDVDVDAGLKGSWVITRLCSLSDKGVGDVGNNCAAPLKGSRIQDPGRGALGYTEPRPELKFPSPYYRIIARVTGPRNSVTYTETIVNLTTKPI